MPLARRPRVTSCWMLCHHRYQWRITSVDVADGIITAHANRGPLLGTKTTLLSMLLLLLPPPAQMCLLRPSRYITSLALHPPPRCLPSPVTTSTVSQSPPRTLREGTELVHHSSENRVTAVSTPRTMLPRNTYDYFNQTCILPNSPHCISLNNTICCATHTYKAAHRPRCLGSLSSGSGVRFILTAGTHANDPSSWKQTESQCQTVGPISAIVPPAQMHAGPPRQCTAATLLRPTLLIRTVTR